MSGLTRSDIDDILKLIDGSDFNELKLEMGDVKLEIRRGGAPEPSTPAMSDPGTSLTPESQAIETTKPITALGSGSEIKAPLLGTFYLSPKPGADPFVKLGDTVTEETVIGIIEVMKLMNSVPAGVAGVVTEIIAEDGKLVEHDQSLIRVQPV